MPAGSPSRLARPRTGRRARWPRNRLTGCLLWILGLIIVLIILLLLFGGFQKGTKAGAGAGAGGAAAQPAAWHRGSTVSIGLPSLTTLPAGRHAPADAVAG